MEEEYAYQITPKGVLVLATMHDLYRNTSLSDDEIAKRVGLEDGEDARAFYRLGEAMGLLDEIESIITGKS